MTPGTKCTVEDRFWKHVEKRSTCWIWTGPTTTPDPGNDYGVFSFDGNRLLAHRWSYEQFRGPITPGMFVLHRCDTPRCVNPEHLFLGTTSDNHHDKAVKGRARNGAMSGARKGPYRPGPRVTEAERFEMWRRYRRGETQSQIARALNRSQTCASNVLRSFGYTLPGLRPHLSTQSRVALIDAAVEEVRA